MESTLSGPEGWAPPALSDHLLEEFLIRIDTPTDLIRTSATCKAFRRVVTDPTFLRRYRSLHPHPPLLGFILSPVFGFQPHRTFAGADVTASFCFDHLPDWRGGWSVWRALEVVGPWSTSRRRPGGTCCVQLLDARLNSVASNPTLLTVHTEHEDIIYFDDAFFDPTGSYNEAHFSIMCWTRGRTIGAIFLYTSVFRAWTHVASANWHALGFDVQLLQWGNMYGFLPNWCHGHAYDCLYWKHGMTWNLIKLDINSMEFSTVSIPPGYERRVEAGGGRIEIFGISYFVVGRKPPQSLCYIRQNGRENADEHPVGTTIPLPDDAENYNLYFIGGSVAEEYIFLEGGDGTGRTACFSLEIKTMMVERICLPSDVSHRIPYFEFPPSMLTRTM